MNAVASRSGLASGALFFADLAVFLGLHQRGASLGDAQLAGFFSGLAVFLILNARVVRFSGLRFLSICLVAVFLRGGVLNLSVAVWNGPLIAGYLVTIATGAAVLYYGGAFSNRRSLEGAATEFHWRTIATVTAIYLLALKLVYAGGYTLIPEEAYYWNYAQHPAMGYLDHPPMVAWLITIGTFVFGHTEFGVRFGAFLSWMITAGFVLAMTRNIQNRESEYRVLLILAILPFFFATGLLMTPDAPLTACWAATLYFLERALIGEKRAAWVGAGIGLGLGLLSKYTIALLGPATLLFLLLDRRSRRWFLRPEPYLCVAIALVLFSPVILWNARHEWASFMFQSARRIEQAARFGLHLLIASVLVLLAPIAPGALVLAMVDKKKAYIRAIKGEDGKSNRCDLFMAVFLLVPLSVFVFFSLTHAPKLNWTGPAFLAALPLIAWQMTAPAGDRFPKTNAWFKRAWKPTVVILVLLYGVASHYFVLGLPGMSYPKNTVLFGWRELGQKIEAIEVNLARQTGRKPLVIGLDRYMISSELAFYARTGDPAQSVRAAAGRHLVGRDALMYEYWFPPEDYSGRDIIMVTRKEKDLADDRLSGYFDRLDPVESMEIHYNGRPVATYYFRIGHGYRPAAG
jgi:dolichol-phosphate mannosyltransferase